MLSGSIRRAVLVTCLGTACLSGCAVTPRGPAAPPEDVVAEQPRPSPRSRPALPPTPPRTPVGTAAPAATHVTDLWAAIADELQLRPSPRHPLGAPLAHFHDSARFIDQATANARPFLQHIHAEVVKRGLPLDVLLLPVIESAYNPAATSPGGAAGLWQLIPATGRRFGLPQSRWYDGRRDVVASTRAALDYLALLYQRFDRNVELMFAAYNCGERTVELAIERNRGRGRRTDFWSLDLPRGTRAFVPKLIALAEILRAPAAHGVRVARIPDTPYFESVQVDTGLDLNRVIDWSEMDGAAFSALNAAYVKRYTAAGMPTTVHVPVGQAAAVATMVAKLPRDTRTQDALGGEHIVAKGETLSHIAARHGTSVAALQRANRLTSTRLRIGQRLSVPGSATSPAAVRAVASSGAREHRVVEGDNLWVLARRYGTNVDALASANDLPQDATLRPGQRLQLPGTRRARQAVPARPQPLHYEVRKGESLWSISPRFRVSVAELKRLNQLGDGGQLQPGQRLVVAQPGLGADARDI